MNVALASLEAGWFMFGKATALKSRERIILSLSTRQHIHKNILFRRSTNVRHSPLYIMGDVAPF